MKLWNQILHKFFGLFLDHFWNFFKKLFFGPGLNFHRFRNLHQDLSKHEKFGLAIPYRSRDISIQKPQNMPFSTFFTCKMRRKGLKFSRQKINFF